MKFKSSIIAVALASGMVSAMADDSIGNLPIAPLVYSHTVSGLTPGASFSDWYTFTFPSLASTASGSALTINVQKLLNISNFALQLYDDGGPATKLADGVTTGASAVLFNYPLTAGQNYNFKVMGDVDGSAGGAYAFMASAAPVPEPETFAMLLAGLGVIGTIAARRRNRANSD